MGLAVHAAKHSKREHSKETDNNYCIRRIQRPPFNGIVLRILDKEIASGYKKTNFAYNDSKIDAYQEVKLDIVKNTYALTDNEITGNNFYLFYAVNMETGKEELYQYEEVLRVL